MNTLTATIAHKFTPCVSFARHIHADTYTYKPLLLKHTHIYLSYEGVRLHGAIGIHLRHVHVVNEVDHLLGARRTKILPCFLLKGLLHYLLQHEGGSVVVEGEGCHQHVLTKT